MDARCVDRPAAVVLAEKSHVVSALIVVLIERGYDVYLPVYRQDSPDYDAPKPWEVDGHPRLHPVLVDSDAANYDVRAAVRQSGSPLAFVVCGADDDVLEQSRLVLSLRRWLRGSGVLVVGRPGFAERPQQMAGVRLAWVTPGRVLPGTGLLRRRRSIAASAVQTARQVLDGLAEGPNVVRCNPTLLES